MSEKPNPKGVKTLVIAAVKAAVLLAFLAATTWGAVYLIGMAGFSLSELHHITALKHRFDDVMKPVSEWVQSSPILGRLAFIGVQIGQIVIFIVPGEVTQAFGGYLFGTWEGALYCVIGAAIGSALAFLIADWLGRPLVKLFISPEQFSRFENIMNGRKGLITTFVLFLIPGSPKDTLCYIAGLTPIHFGWFVLLSTLARVPGIFLSTFMGDSVAERHYHMFIALCTLGVLMILVALFFRKRIELWIERRHPEAK